MSIESFPYTIFSEDWWYDETEEGRMNTCSEVLEYFRNTPNLEELPLSFDANLTPIQNLSAIRYGIGTMLEALNEGEMVAVVHCIPMVMRKHGSDANFGVIVFDGTQNEPFWNHFGITVWDGEVNDFSETGIRIPPNLDKAFFNRMGDYNLHEDDTGHYLICPTDEADFFDFIGFDKRVALATKKQSMRPNKVMGQENRVYVHYEDGSNGTLTMFVQTGKPPRIYPASNAPYPKWLLKAFEDAKL